MGKKLIIKNVDWFADAINFLTIGKLFDSLSGLDVQPLTYTYVYKYALPKGKVFFNFQSSLGSATFTFKVFTLSGNQFKQVGVDKVVNVKSGEWVDINLSVEDGQYIGIYGGNGVAFAASSDDEIPHLSATANNVSVVDATTDFATQFSFLFGIAVD